MSRSAGRWTPDAALPLMIAVGIATAIAVGLQHYLIRASVRAMAASFRFRLGITSAEAGTLYQEIQSGQTIACGLPPAYQLSTASSRQRPHQQEVPKPDAPTPCGTYSNALPSCRQSSFR